MGLSYFLTAILVEATNFMMLLALIIGLLCKNMRMALIAGIAVGIVGAMETHITLLFEFNRLKSLIWMHTAAKFVSLLLVVLATQGIKDLVCKYVLKRAVKTGEAESYTRARFVISIIGLIVGIGLYFILPVFGVGIILGSFFKRPSLGVIAGTVWTIFYISLLFFVFMDRPHSYCCAGSCGWLWLPWDSVLLGILTPPLTIYAKIALAKKIAFLPYFKAQ